MEFFLFNYFIALWKTLAIGRREINTRFKIRSLIAGRRGARARELQSDDGNLDQFIILSIGGLLCKQTDDN